MMCFCRSIDARSVQGDDGSTLLHEAVLAENKEAIEFLLEHHSLIPADAVDDNGLSALHIAVINKQDEMVRELLKNRSMRRHINIQDNDGNTPLHWAAQLPDRKNIIEQLVEFASLTVTNEQDRTPLDLACEHDHHGYINLLTTNRWFPSNLHKRTLIFMARNGFSDYIDQLDDRYFSELDKPVEADTALAVALKAGQYETAFKLIDRGADYSQLIDFKDHNDNRLTHIVLSLGG